MSYDHQDVEADRRLSRLLRESRRAPALPPGFEDAVWQRIERAAASREAPAWGIVARLTEAIVGPRFAVASLSAALALGVLTGIWQGQGHAKAVALARYVATVAPWQGR